MFERELETNIVKEKRGIAEIFTPELRWVSSGLFVAHSRGLPLLSRSISRREKRGSSIMATQQTNRGSQTLSDICGLVQVVHI